MFSCIIELQKAQPRGSDPQWTLGKELTGLIEKRIPVGILSQKKGKTTSSLFKSQFHAETTTDIKTRCNTSSTRTM
uniref:Putative ovule protein n=1 Tax=Solanum chacoense TaxID=4108 RepID=A0A0V0GXE4_SOLCH